MLYSVLLFFCYIIGALPTSYILVKCVLGKDIRTMGSGNSGATNTGRFLGRAGFFIVLLIDALKAYLVLVITGMLCGCAPALMLLATAAVYIGNAYSPFIGFSGGKGVATTVGIMFYLFSLWLLFACLIIFAVVAHRFNRVDVASLSSAGAAPLLLFLAGAGAHSVLSALAIAVWIWARHWKNIMHFLGYKI